MNLSIRVISRLGIVLMMVLAGTIARADPKEQTTRAEAAFRAGDLVTAMALLKQAADAGYAPAQARLGDMLDAAEQDAEAVALYRKAADQGDPAGAYGLGRMFAQGEGGVPRDAAQALSLYRKAAEKNHWPAIEALARAYRTGGLGLARDLAEAGRLDQRAKELRETAAKASQ
jgi:TPR repeat protein